MSHGSPALIKKGSACIHMSWIVPGDKEEELDAFWREHEKWMRETHTVGNVFPEDETKPRLLAYYIAKGVEMKNPMNPEEGTTGNVTYQMVETYVDDSDVQRHMKIAPNFSGFASGKMQQYMKDYGTYTAAGSDKIFCALAE